MKVKRAGNKFTGSYSVNGSVWTQLGSGVTISLGATLPAGAAVCAHSATALCSSTFPASP